MSLHCKCHTLLLLVFACLFGVYAFSQDTLVRFQPESMYQIEEIALNGNKVTKDFIIYRELEFTTGVSLSGESLNVRVNESRENLLNTALFNFVTISFISFDKKEGVVSGKILIDVIERWYIWPNPIFEFADRNFNAWLQEKDFTRINYGMFLTWDNFRGRKEKLIMLTRFGYDEKYDLFYEIPYINKKKTLGLGIGFGFSQGHEIAVRSVNDTLDYIKLENGYPSRELSSALQLIYRPDIRNTHTFQLGFNQFIINDTVFQVNPLFSINQNKTPRYFSLYYKYKSDFRDFVAYPLHGYYFDVVMQKYGLGILNGNVNVFTLQTTFRKYWELADRLYFASMLTAQFSSDHEIPYFIQSGMGYGRFFVRGYEYYVIDGQKFSLSRSNLKFAVVPTRVGNIGFIPTERFSKIHYAIYLNAFFDAGYVGDDQYEGFNELPDELLYGYGLGLDFVTYYDVVFRFEFSLNRQQESGFFIHFMAPI